jgi:hypothetical protein
MYRIVRAAIHIVSAPKYRDNIVLIFHVFLFGKTALLLTVHLHLSHLADALGCSLDLGYLDLHSPFIYGVCLLLM